MEDSKSEKFAEEKQQILCVKHPEYKAVYAPRVDCIDCWKGYAHAKEKEVESYKISYEVQAVRNQYGYYRSR